MESLHKIGGMLVWYYYICKREVWYSSHGIQAIKEHPHVSVGRLIHDSSFEREKKEILIDNTIRLDILPDEGVIGEVKKSSRHLKSARMQLAYYLYYLKHYKDIEQTGVLLIPEEKKRIEIALTPELEQELEETIRDIRKIQAAPKPPPPRRCKFCRSCAYAEICWA